MKNNKRSKVWSQFKHSLNNSDDHFTKEGGANQKQSQKPKAKESSTDDYKVMKMPEIDQFELNCYNLYLLIDDVNDGAIDYNEVTDSCMKTKDGLLNKWKELYGKTNKVVPDNFYKFLKENASEDEVNELLDHQYRSSIKGCGCFTYCCKKVRSSLIKSEFIKYKSMTDPSFKNSKQAQSLKEKVIVFILNCVKLYSYFGKLADFLGDMLILWVVYNQSRTEDHLGNIGFLIVIVINLICGFSTFLICYSSMLNIAFSEGIYEPDSMRKATCFEKSLRIFFLSCFGPLFPVLITAFSFIEYSTYILLLLCGNKGFEVVERSFTLLYKNLFGLSRRQKMGLEAQSAIAQLLFQSLPMLILKTCMILGYPDLQLEEESNQSAATLIAISFGLAFLNVFNTFLKIWVESKALQEPFILYTLNCLKAQHGWIPFSHMFKRGDQLALIMDYSQIKIKFPLLTNMTGFYKKMNFQFETTSLIEFSTQIVLYSNNLLTTDGLVKADGPPTYERILAVEAPKEKTLFEKIPDEYLSDYRRHFDMLDTDKDGFIEKQELLDFIKKQRADEEGSGDDSYEGGYDTESDGSNEDQSDQREVEQFFNEYDLNQDGKVSFEEFATINAKYDGLDRDRDQESEKDEQEQQEEEEKETFYHIADKLRIGQSLEKISLNLAVHTYDISRLPGIDVDFSGVDWKQLLSNSLELNQIIVSNTNKKKLQAYTISGKPCIWVCVDMEPTVQQKKYHKPFDLKECMQLLLQRKIDTDITDSSGETLLIHAIKTNKLESIDLLIQSGTDIHMPNQKGMTPLGQSIKDNRYDVFKRLMDLGAKIHEKCVYDVGVSKKLCSPIEYLAKKMKKNKQFVEKGQAQKFISIFAELSVKAEKEDEKIAIFKYISHCFNLPNFPQAAYRLKSTLCNDLDVLTIKDQKGKNFAHQLVKNWTDKSTDKNLEDQLHNFANYRSKLGELFWVKNKAGISPMIALIKSEKYENETHLTFVSSIMKTADKEINDEQSENIVLDFYKGKLNDDSQGKLKAQQKIEDFEKKELRQYFINKQLYDQMIAAALEIANLPYVPIANSKKQLVSKGDPQQQVNTEDQAKSYAINDENTTIDEKNLQESNNDQDNNDNARMTHKATLAYEKSLIQQQDEFEQVQVMKQSGIEAVFKYLIEVIGFCDLIGDVYCLRIYILSNHYAWASITIFQMLSPFFVSYVPLVNYWIHLGSFGIYQQGKKKISLIKRIFGYMALFPIFLVYLTVMDLLYLVETVFLHPISVLLSWLSGGYCNFSFISDTIEGLYEILFDMGENDIEGFRRLRTISQLLFESIPQIMLQLRMMHYFLVEHNDPEELERIGVNMNAILLSLMFAVVHVLIELQFLALDSKACKTTKMHYIIICLNGRFGWVPFTHKFLSSNLNDQEQRELLDYDDIQSSLCGMKLKVFFKFDESTCDNFIKAISSLPIEEGAEKRVNISIGKCIEEVSFESFLNLLDIGYKRVNFNIENVNIQFMIEQSDDYNTPVTANTASIDPDMKAKWITVLEKMVNQGYNFMVETLVQLGVQIKEDDAALFFKTAMENKDGQMVQTLLRLNKKKIFEQSYIFLQRFIQNITANNASATQNLEGALQHQQDEDPFAEIHGVNDIKDQLVELDAQVIQNMEDIENLYWYLFMINLGNLSRLQFLEFMKEQVRKINVKTIEIKMKCGWYIDGFVFCNQQGQELFSRQDQGGDWGKGLILNEGEYCIKIEQWKDDEEHLMRTLFTMSTGRTHDFKASKYASYNQKDESYHAPDGKFIASVAQTGYCGPITSAVYEAF